ncbi:MAG: SDR family oxidoreductase [bacterium]|nr:SDR family oxidoreductase [bacterium]
MTLPTFGLDGRVALVTGSASGLGKAITLGLAACGARVVCVDIDDAANRQVADQVGGVAITLDVTDAGAVERSVDEIAAQTDGIDILVNSAGIGGRCPAVSYPLDLMDRVIDVNLKGTFLMCRSTGRRMVEAGRGSIVNIASIGGLVAFPGSVGYQASKGGVVQLTRALAVEWASSGVRVNAVAPGHVATELVRRQWESEPELKEYFLSRTPLNRLATPREIAGPVVFLAGDASAMVTGQVIAVDGGYTAQ